MPPSPAARASPATSSSRAGAGSDVSAGGEDVEGEVSSASPARMAVASSNALWTVGWPRLQIVVVHRRQVVVDQRIAVHAFERRRDRRVRRHGSASNSAALSMTRNGRSRLPPLSTPWRIAASSLGRPRDLAGAEAGSPSSRSSSDLDLGRARGKHRFESGASRRRSSRASLYGKSLRGQGCGRNRKPDARSRRQSLHKPSRPFIANG